VDNARFRRPVEPGDQVIFRVQAGRAVRGVWKYSVVAEVDGKTVASADIMAALREIQP
jgi:3-hydroxyacyl-[acyl-carrier-protein] dehydratase